MALHDQHLLSLTQRNAPTRSSAKQSLAWSWAAWRLHSRFNIQSVAQAILCICTRLFRAALVDCSINKALRSQAPCHCHWQATRVTEHTIGPFSCSGSVLIWCRYPAQYTSTSYSFQGLYGYKVFLAIALILGDALYNLVKVMYKYSVRLYEIYRLGLREKEMTEDEFDEGGFCVQFCC